MKIIKTYEGFFNLFKKKVDKRKSAHEILKNNREELESCFLDLKDIGFKVDIWEAFGGTQVLEVKIQKRKITFDGKDVLENLLFVISYLNAEFGLRLIWIDAIANIKGINTNLFKTQRNDTPFKPTKSVEYLIKKIEETITNENRIIYINLYFYTTVKYDGKGDFDED